MSLQVLMTPANVLHCRHLSWLMALSAYGHGVAASRLQVKQILVEGSGESARAVGVRLADGRVFRGKAVVSNATRWDTFEGLLADEVLPQSERLFRSARQLTQPHARVCPVPLSSLSVADAASHGVPPKPSSNRRQ
jgi:hypothetical protein